MRCKKHPCDLSSSAGVCASCLRERLFLLIAAQAQAQAQHQQPQLHSYATLDDTRKSDSHSHPPPLLFPRSVSPYVARRKSDDTSSSHHVHFYSTPQVGPTFNNNYSSSSTTSTSFSFRKKHSRLSLFSSLFRSRSDKFNPDPASRDSSDASPSWLSSIFPGGRKQKSRFFSTGHSSTVGRKPRRMADRGMSPARGADSDEDCQNCDQCPSGSGYSSESSHDWKRTSVTPSTVRRGKSGHVPHVTGLAFCLSPLVRASPNRHWNQKGGLPPDMGCSGDVRVPVKPHLSTAASFCANRSRKLADFGRVNHNR